MTSVLRILEENTNTEMKVYEDRGKNSYAVQAKDMPEDTRS